MKPSSNRLNRSHSMGRARAPKDTVSSSRLTSSSQKEIFPRFPSLEELPRPVELPQRPIGAPKSTTSFEPLSESELSSLLPLIGNTVDYITTPTTHSDAPPSDTAAEESTDFTATSDIPSTLVNQVLVERNLLETGNGDISTADGSIDMLKEVACISQPQCPTILTDLVTSNRPPSPHPDKLGYNDGASIEPPRYHSSPSPSMLSFPFTCWSDGADKDLVKHIGPSERNRQELMWEIVTSEERYVAELLKMKETFINPLLHPYTDSSSSTMHDDMSQLETPVDSLEHLPIASRFLSSPVDGSDESEEDKGKARTTFYASCQGAQDNLSFVPELDPRSPLASRKPRDSFVFLSRSHQSLQLPSRRKHNAMSTTSLDRSFFVESPSTEKGRDRGRKSTSICPSARGMQQKPKESFSKADLITNGGVAPHQIPDDLRQCLEVIEDSILPGHIKLGECLRKRYDEQYPLVRSLADVFVANSHILRGYADYVLHLKRALEQANDAISTSNLTKPRKNKDENEWLKVSAFLRKLEMDAQDRGETGLAISLSKPFQRLLNYSMLFRALLFHTDPWMLEYEGALQLVSEVEDIIRDIEDAKDQKEKYDKTRDIFARIKGLDKVKQLAVPKPSRLFVEEKMLNPREDVLRSGGGGIGSRKDVWLVVFNDVVLRCLRTGITSLPLGAAHSSRPPFEPQGSSKFATTGRKNPSRQSRNLYKFIKIENWAIGDVNPPREGVVSMEDVVRSRAQIYSAVQPRRSVHSDIGRHQKRTFSHWSTDNVILQKSLARSQIGPAGYGSRQTESSPSLYSGSSRAKSKSGSHLASANSLFSGGRPMSRLTVTTPSPCSAMSDEGHSIRAFGRLGLGEHDWGQIEPTAPFLYSKESFSDAKFGGRLVPLNPLLTRDRSLNRQAVVLDGVGVH